MLVACYSCLRKETRVLIAATHTKLHAVIRCNVYSLCVFACVRPLFLRFLVLRYDPLRFEKNDVSTCLIYVYLKWLDCKS